MPFVARDKATGARIDTTRVLGPHEIDREHLVCQVCGEGMILKWGKIVHPHFAHRPDSDCVYSRESPQHVYAKAYIRDALEKRYNDTPGVTIELEWRVPGTEQEPENSMTARIADVAVLHESGWIEVHEAQLSSTTVEELKARTYDYERAGASITWWLGGSADTEAHREWCIATVGFVHRLDFAVETRAA